ncbi:MAG: hypothetical protein ILO34_08265, partial [Kiritimatiellae bacterium]|nr:hypothetical protein [Kiritimatiellia bacterium]
MKRTFAIVASAMALAFAYARNACARGDALPFTSVGSHVVTNFSGTVTSEMLDGGDAIFVYEKGSGYELEIAGQVRAWILAVGGGGAGGSGATAANLANYG